MGRKSSFSEGGGGKFNNIDGVILSYEFTTSHPFAKEGQRRRGKSDFSPLYAVLTARMDGAEADDVDVMLVGDANDFEVEDDGLTLMPAKDGQKVWEKSQWAKFIRSWEAAADDGAEDEDTNGGFNYSPIVNTRVRFMQEVQLDKTGKVKTRKGKGRDGKERDYNDTTTVVSAFYGTADAPVKGRAATATKTTKAAGGKANGKAVEVDLTQMADAALVGLLDKFGGSATVAKLIGASGQLYLKKNYPDTADELRKIVGDPDFLNAAVEREAISEFDGTTASAL